MITAPRTTNVAAIRARWELEAWESETHVFRAHGHSRAYDRCCAYWRTVLAVTEPAYWERVAGLQPGDDLTPVTGPDGKLWPKAVAP
jgi:hypothetical protein